MMISGILFDKDGTLFDFEQSWSGFAQTVLLDLAGGCPDQAAGLGARVGFDMRSGRFAPESCLIAGTDADVAEALLPVLPELDAQGVQHRMSQAAARAAMVPLLDLAPLLDELRAMGLRLGVATNDSDHAVRTQLANAGLAERFDFIAGFDTGHGAKPGPGMCRAFADRFELPPSGVLMVGDSLHDIHAGRAAGMVTVGVLSGMGARAVLSPEADLIVEDIGHLPALLREGRALQAAQETAKATQTESQSVAI